jgi:hypothetical protein
MTTPATHRAIDSAHQTGRRASIRAQAERFGRLPYFGIVWKVSARDSEPVTMAAAPVEKGHSGSSVGPRSGSRGRVVRALGQAASWE